jgi:hypothetical protein
MSVILFLFLFCLFCQIGIGIGIGYSLSQITKPPVFGVLTIIVPSICLSSRYSNMNSNDNGNINTNLSHRCDRGSSECFHILSK